MDYNGNFDEMMETNVDALVTVTTIRQSISIADLMSYLRQRRTTGQLRLDLRKGGVRHIELTERTCPDSETKRDRIREILKKDMENH